MNRQGSFFAALGGHAVDLARLARFQVANPHSYSKTRQIKAFGRRIGAKQFIETGTYLGNTTMRCSGTFEKVITIELDPGLFKQAKQYLSKRSNVECIEGDALKELPKILARPDVNDAIVFLDGHFSGTHTAHGDLAEPACEEIEVLASHKAKIRGFIVDDFRCFGTDKGWPKKSELVKSVETHFPEFDLAIHLDQLLAWRKA